MELKGFLEDRNHTQKRDQALNCVREVMETSEVGLGARFSTSH